MISAEEAELFHYEKLARDLLARFGTFFGEAREWDAIPSDQQTHWVMCAKAEEALAELKAKGITIDPGFVLSLDPGKVARARRAYHRYGDYVEWKNYQGLPMPRWEALTDRIRNAWIVSVNGD